jgi:hypothetical protein
MKKSPRISHISWGQIKVDDEKQYKDVKLYPGGSREWDWSETGTHHTPGIQPADVRELLERGANVIVLSKGFDERLQISSETIQLLQEKGIPFHILQTEEAAKKYNQLCEKESVGGLFHSTC